MTDVRRGDLGRRYARLTDRSLDQDRTALFAAFKPQGSTGTRCDGVLTARDHQDLGCCLSRLGSLGVVNEFHDKTIDPSIMCDVPGHRDHLVA